MHIGSTLSLRSFCRLGSALSVYGINRLGSSLSVLDFMGVGSSLSLRSFIRLGSSLSVYGLARLGSSMSILDFLHVGASLSVRSFCRFGSYLRATQYQIVSDTAESKIAGSIRAAASVNTPDQDIEVRHGNPDAGGDTRVLTLRTDGGTLHGFWNADEVISTSDPELKEDIGNLEDYAEAGLRSRNCGTNSRQCHHRDQTLRRTSARFNQQGTGASRPVRSFAPLLKELRPVAYRYKNTDPDRVRFGFVADELEALVPEVVRRVGEEGGKTRKGVVYQDLIALLAAALREHQGRLEAVERSGASEKSPEQEGEPVHALRQELQELKGTVAIMQDELAKIKQQCDCAKSL